LLLLVVAVTASVACADLPVGSPPPPLSGDARAWINSPPLTWQELSGKVVLVDFMEYTCVNCIRTFPYLKAWYERYKPYGFVIVGIHTPEFRFDSTRANVAEAAKRFGLTFPILSDPDSVNWQLYNENFWPSKYLFDQDGRLVVHHAGEGGYQEMERRIQDLLRKDHPDAKFAKPLAAVRPGDVEGAVCRTDTPELYANPSRGTLADLPRQWKRDHTVTITDPGRHAEGKIYAQGAFLPRYQSLQHARTTTDLRDYVAIRYRATEVNVVVNRPRGHDYRVYATLDGAPIPKDSKGDDVKYDARGSYFDVTSPRMYNAIRGPWGVHELRLASDSADFDVYSYTFSGCPQR
jgi:thiol-disulfide isomerase/thioredoxin